MEQRPKISTKQSAVQNRYSWEHQEGLCKPKQGFREEKDRKAQEKKSEEVEQRRTLRVLKAGCKVILPSNPHFKNICGARYLGPGGPIAPNSRLRLTQLSELFKRADSCKTANHLLGALGPPPKTLDFTCPNTLHVLRPPRWIPPYPTLLFISVKGRGLGAQGHLLPHGRAPPRCSVPL